MTPSLGLLLTTCALLAAPAKDDSPTAQAEDTLRRVSKLPPDHQRVWLRLVEQRCAWAALLTMKPDDAKREQERVATLLRQKTVGWNDLVALLRQLDQREKAAIARMVRQYRAEVYDTFRKRQQELIERQEAWYRIWSAWEKAGSPPDQQDRLMDWLADAIKASSKETTGPLPADPKFGDGVLVPEALVKRLTQPPAGPDEGKPAPPAQPPEEPDLTTRLAVREPLPAKLPGPGPAAVARQPAEGIVARRGEDAELADHATAVAAVVPSLPSLPSVAADDPKALTAPPSAARYGMAINIRTEATVETAAAAGSIGPNGSEAQPRAVADTRGPSELPSRAIDTPSVDVAVAPRVPTSAPQPAALPQDRTTYESRPMHGEAPHGDVVALLPPGLSRSTETEPAGPSTHTVQRRSLAPDLPSDPPGSVRQPAPGQATSGDQHAQVNIDELRTRIEGINLSLRTLEAELNEKREYTVDQLDSLLNRLDILVLRQRDLTLFRDLITPPEQAKVGQIDSSRTAVATMGTRIAELRLRVRNDDTMPEAERASALKHLDDLSDRLATLTAEK